METLQNFKPSKTFKKITQLWVKRKEGRNWLKKQVFMPSYNKETKCLK